MLEKFSFFKRNPAHSDEAHEAAVQENKNLITDAVIAQEIASEKTDTPETFYRIEDQKENIDAQAHIEGYELSHNKEAIKAAMVQIDNRLYALHYQIAAINEYIDAHSGTTDLEQFNSLSEQKDTLEKLKAATETELPESNLLDALVQDLKSAQIKRELKGVVEKIDASSPSLTPEIEQALEEKRALLEKEYNLLFAIRDGNEQELSDTLGLVSQN